MSCVGSCYLHVLTFLKEPRQRFFLLEFTLYLPNLDIIVIQKHAHKIIASDQRNTEISDI